MDDLLQGFHPVKVQPGQLIEGTVITIQKSGILLDLNGTLTGIITGKEMKDNANTIDKFMRPDLTLDQLKSLNQKLAFPFEDFNDRDPNFYKQ